MHKSNKLFAGSITWASMQQNLSSRFSTKSDSNKSPNFQTRSVLTRPRSHENIEEISAKSPPKHPSCESCRGGILVNSQPKLSVLLF